MGKSKSAKNKPAERKVKKFKDSSAKTTADYQLKEDLSKHKQYGARSVPKTAKVKRKKRRSSINCKFIMRRASFGRVVREIGERVSATGRIRFRKAAIEALQEASEAMIVKELAMVHLTALHAGRCTIHEGDMRYIQRIKDMMEGRNMPDFGVE